jgi:hypothetical protein
MEAVWRFAKDIEVAHKTPAGPDSMQVPVDTGSPEIWSLLFLPAHPFHHPMSSAQTQNPQSAGQGRRLGS